MSSAEVPDDPFDRRDDVAETRHEMIVDAAIEAEMATGRREETEQQARRHIVKRIAIIVGGATVTIVGIALMPLPGPGLVVVALGLGLMSSEVPFAARLLERVKERLPQDADGKIPKKSIVFMAVVGVVAMGASSAFSVWWRFIRDVN